MKISQIKKRFGEIGASIEVIDRSGLGRSNRGISMDYKNGTFSIIIDHGKDEKPPRMEVVDVQVKDRHLLLHTTEGDLDSPRKFLCGHDERDWFVAGVENIGVRNVDTAKQSLKPKAVREAEKGLKHKNRHNRKNSARLRQGEWFFIPAPNFKPKSPELIKKNEPLQSQPGSKPHICSEAYISGGKTVVIGIFHTKTMGHDHRIFNSWELFKVYKDAHAGDYISHKSRIADANVHARGTVRHSDHATLKLAGWHKVEMASDLGIRTRSGPISNHGIIFLD